MEGALKNKDHLIRLDWLCSLARASICDFKSNQQTAPLCFTDGLEEVTYGSCDLSLSLSLLIYTVVVKVMLASSTVLVVEIDLLILIDSNT